MKLVEDFEPPENKEILVKTSGGMHVVAMYRKYNNEANSNQRGSFYLQCARGVIVDAVWWKEL